MDTYFVQMKKNHFAIIYVLFNSINKLGFPVLSVMWAICLSILICSHARVQSERERECVCPGSTPEWDISAGLIMAYSLWYLDPFSPL